MKIEFMKCDLCGKEIDNNKAYWAERIVSIKLSCPSDGINGDSLEADLCRNCRERIDKGIRTVAENIKQKSGK